jgi:MFS family permease
MMLFLLLTATTVMLLVLWFGGGYLLRFGFRGGKLKRGSALERDRHAAELKRFRDTAVEYSLLWLGIDAVLSLWLNWEPAVTWTIKMLGVPRARMAIALTVVVLGVFASWYRRQNRFLYGVIEIFFGGAGAWVAAWHVSVPHDLFPAAATLGGCVYVVARGCTNVIEQMEREGKVGARIFVDAVYRLIYRTP